MSHANPLWGAPRVHGELLKLGIDISERTVSRWMPRRTKPLASSGTVTSLSPAGTLYFQPSGRITSDGAGAVAVNATVAIAGESDIVVVGDASETYFAIEQELGLPVRFVGTGEKADDFAEFDPKAFVEGIFG